jgi:hypothetical protein
MSKGPDGAVLLDAGTPADATGQGRTAARPRRAFFLVSVRGLLLLILLIGCGLGWVAQVIRTGTIQRRAVAAINQAGGWAMYDTEWEEPQNTSAWKPRWPKWLVDRLGVDSLANVVFVNLHDRGNDQVLEQVARLKHLRQLHRPGFAVSDAGLSRVGRLSELQLLSLDGSQVTDAGLIHLKKLKQLKWLKLTRTKVTDAGVAELKKSLANLQVLR